MKEPGASPYEFAAGQEPQKRTARPPPKVKPDRYCRHCGFGIVGKPRANRCPECGAGLDAASADGLQYARPRWVRMVSWGALLLALAAALHVAGGVLGFMRISPWAQRAHPAAAVAALLGAWLLTSRWGDAVRQKPWLALWVRCVTLLTALAWTMIFLADAGLLPATLLERLAPMRGLTIATLVLMSGECVAVGVYASRLSARIPDDSLKSRTLNLGWLIGGACLFVAFYLATGLEPYVGTFFFCSLPIIGALLGLMVWLVITLLQLTIELRNTASTGERLALKRAQRETGKGEAPSNQGETSSPRP